MSIYQQNPSCNCSPRTFIETNIFTKSWFDLGLTDDDLILLQQALINNPKLGKVIPGTGSLRKLRFKLKGKGKRGGARIVYVDFLQFETIYLVYVYSKSEEVDLTQGEKKLFVTLINQLKKELKKEESNE